MSTLGTVAIVLAAVVALVAFATRRATSGASSVGPRGADGTLATRDLWKLGRSGDAIERAAAALRANDAIDAVRIVREATGLGLAESKRVVDELRKQLESGGPLAKLLATVAPDPSDDAPELADVRAAVREGRTIEAIKLHREKTGAGLADSKAAVDRIAAKLRG